MIQYTQRLFREFEQYLRDQDDYPYLPKLSFFNDTHYQFEFNIPDHPPFKLDMEFLENYPFKAPDIHIRPMPPALESCSVGTKFLLWSVENPTALTITHRILSIYSLVTDELKCNIKLPEVVAAQERLDQYVADLREKDRQFEDDLTKAIQLSVEIN